MLPRPERACLLIVDVSGYTGYLAGTELDHAQDILADLMSTVVRALRGQFRLAKLEGDAAFAYALTDQVDASSFLDLLEATYIAFRRRLRDIRQATSCQCDPCRRIGNLDLKAVAHHGAVVRQRVAGREELVGSPAARPTWQHGVLQVIEEPSDNGRRGVGTTNHCIHGAEAVVEEILDWRPNEYVTLRSQLPIPGVPKVRTTILLTPVGEETDVTFRVEVPRSARARAAMQPLADGYIAGIQASFDGAHPPAGGARAVGTDLMGRSCQQSTAQIAPPR